MNAQSEAIGDLLEGPLTNRTLFELKTRSLRKGIWFRVLSRMERGFVDLTMKWVDKVRNSTMAKVLLRILEKLVLALEQGMAKILRSGRLLALKASETAMEWGNTEAFAWRFERAFWICLGSSART